MQVADRFAENIWSCLFLAVLARTNVLYGFCVTKAPELTKNLKLVQQCSALNCSLVFFRMMQEHVDNWVTCAKRRVGGMSPIEPKSLELLTPVLNSPCYFSICVGIGMCKMLNANVIEGIKPFFFQQTKILFSFYSFPRIKVSETRFVCSPYLYYVGHPTVKCCAGMDESQGEF